MLLDLGNTNSVSAAHLQNHTKEQYEITILHELSRTGTKIAIQQATHITSHTKITNTKVNSIGGLQSKNNIPELSSLDRLQRTGNRVKATARTIGPAVTNIIIQMVPPTVSPMATRKMSKKTKQWVWRSWGSMGWRSWRWLEEDPTDPKKNSIWCLRSGSGAGTWQRPRVGDQRFEAFREPKRRRLVQGFLSSGQGRTTRDWLNARRLHRPSSSGPCFFTQCTVV